MFVPWNSHHHHYPNFNYNDEMMMRIPWSKHLCSRRLVTYVTPISSTATPSFTSVKSVVRGKYKCRTYTFKKFDKFEVCSTRDTAVS